MIILIFRLLTFCPTIFHEFSCKSVELETDTIFKQDSIKSEIYDEIKNYFPSPESELIVGLLVGSDFFYNVPIFKEQLIENGTIHVAVVSGYNVQLLVQLLLSIFGSIYLPRNFLFINVILILYVWLVGFEAPVVRAWLMIVFALTGKVYGRSVGSLYSLLIVALLMLIHSPSSLFSLSFQLSFLSTLGLFLLTDPIGKSLPKINFIPLSWLREDLVSSIAAQLLVWPLISITFGRISIISPLVNFFSLWSISIATLLGILFLVSIRVSNALAVLFSSLLFIPVNSFVLINEFFSRLSYMNLDFTISKPVFCLYYLALLGIIILFKKINRLYA